MSNSQASTAVIVILAVLTECGKRKASVVEIRDILFVRAFLVDIDWASCKLVKVCRKIGVGFCRKLKYWGILGENFCDFWGKSGFLVVKIHSGHCGTIEKGGKSGYFFTFFSFFFNFFRFFGHFLQLFGDF